MANKKEKLSEAKGDVEDIPALFATIHFKSDHRPNGYTDDEIVELNRIANLRGPKSPKLVPLKKS